MTANRDVESRLFSRGAVICALRKDVRPSTCEVEDERWELKSFLLSESDDYRSLSRDCMPIWMGEMVSEVVYGLGEWWLSVLASTEECWQGDKLKVTPMPDEALEYWLREVCGQYKFAC